MKATPLAGLVAIALANAALPACKRSVREPSLPEPVVQVADAGVAKHVPFFATQFTRKPRPADMAALGRAAFDDPILSATQNLSCRSCHDPGHDFGPPDDRSVQAALVRGKKIVRAIPSLTYRRPMAFTLHYMDDEQGGQDNGPSGGFTWDGRAETRHGQATIPLFSPLELANTSQVELMTRVRDAELGQKLRDGFGNDVFDDVTQDGGRAFVALLMAIEAFEDQPSIFDSLTSKFDAWVAGKIDLSEQEKRGLAAFEDPNRGNCSHCHPDRKTLKIPGYFTDWGHIALAVPRRKDAEPGTDDLGTCGPLRTDLTDHPEVCGTFRAPPLRNVARRKVFMHNGSFTELADVVRFYSERDIFPEKYYSKNADGKVELYDDLPKPYWGNVNREQPFDHKPGDKPPLSDRDIDDIVAFLGTLNDGYQPPTTSPAPAVK